MSPEDLERELDSVRDCNGLLSKSEGWRDERALMEEDAASGPSGVLIAKPRGGSGFGAPLDALTVNLDGPAMAPSSVLVFEVLRDMVKSRWLGPR